MKYIDADKLRAEIGRLFVGEAPKHDQQCDFNDGYFTGIATIGKFLDTLEEPVSEDQPLLNLEIPAGDVAPAEEEGGPWEEDEQ